MRLAPQPFAGRPVSRPRVFGRCLNVEALPLDEPNLIYGVSAHSITQIDVVRDGGIALCIDGDESNRAALMLAEITAGHVRTCLAEGLLRFGGPPVFPVTVDASGEALTRRVMEKHELAGGVPQEWLGQLDQAGLLLR